MYAASVVSVHPPPNPHTAQNMETCWFLSPTQDRHVSCLRVSLDGGLHPILIFFNTVEFSFSISVPQDFSPTLETCWFLSSTNKIDMSQGQPDLGGWGWGQHPIFFFLIQFGFHFQFLFVPWISFPHRINTSLGLIRWETIPNFFFQFNSKVQFSSKNHTAPINSTLLNRINPTNKCQFFSYFFVFNRITIC